jgi:hypothetical protein
MVFPGTAATDLLLVGKPAENQMVSSVSWKGSSKNSPAGLVHNPAGGHF